LRHPQGIRAQCRIELIAERGNERNPPRDAVALGKPIGADLREGKMM